MSFTEYKVNPEYYNNKEDILDNKIIKLISSVHFKGRMEEVELMKAKLKATEQVKVKPEATEQVKAKMEVAEEVKAKPDVAEEVKAKLEAAEEAKAKLDATEQVKTKPEVPEQGKVQAEDHGQVKGQLDELATLGNHARFIISEEKITDNISEGLVSIRKTEENMTDSEPDIEGGYLTNQVNYSMSLSDVRYLMASFPNLKWTFFFVCDPFWKNIKEEDLTRSVVCVAYSRSGVPVANHYRVSLKYDSFDDCLWVKDRSVITSGKDGYTFPFEKDWKANAYVFNKEGKTFLRTASTCGFLQKVENNDDMYQVYRRNMARHNSAMKTGSFYEAMLIDYALLEDITFEFLYHLGIFQTITTRKTNKNIKDQILYIVNQNPEVKEPWTSIRVGMISQKLMIMKSLALWSQKDRKESEPLPESLSGDAYLEKLLKTMQFCDPEHIIDTCDYISWWLKYRNEIMHAMMKTNVYSMDAEIEDIAKEGKKYFRELEKERQRIKKGKIRKFLKMQK